MDQSAAIPPAHSPWSRWLGALAVFYLVAGLLGSEPLVGWARAGQQGSWRLACEGAAAGWAGWLAPTGLPRAQRVLAQSTAAWAAGVAARLGHDADLLGVAAQAVQSHADADLVAQSPAAGSGVPTTAPAPEAAGREAPDTEAVQAEAAPAKPESARTVLLVGDSLMSVGLAPGIAALLRDNPAFRVIRASRSATGLSRPDYFDWQASIQKLVAKHKPEFVVVAMGGNDAQGFRDGKDVLRLGTDTWDDAYRGRVASFAKSACARQAKLLWVGIPRVRSEPFWKNLKHLNDLAQKGLGDEALASYLDSTPFLVDKAGQFASYLPDDKGREQRVRAGDGVHLTEPGGARVAKGVVQWLDKVK